MFFGLRSRSNSIPSLFLGILFPLLNKQNHNSTESAGPCVFAEWDITTVILVQELLFTLQRWFLTIPCACATKNRSHSIFPFVERTNLNKSTNRDYRCFIWAQISTVHINNERLTTPCAGQKLKEHNKTFLFRWWLSFEHPQIINPWSWVKTIISRPLCGFSLPPILTSRNMDSKC